MIETLYAQLLQDNSINSIKFHTDKKGITHTTFYRDDVKVIIRHKNDEFYSCIVIAR